MIKPLSVACPACRAEVLWTDASPWRPFCSARCRAIDLGDWAGNRYLIAGDEHAAQQNDKGPWRNEAGH